MFESWSSVAAPEGVRDWSAFEPCGLLADQLGFEPARGCAELAERVVAWNRMACWSQAAEIRAIGELLAAARADPEFGENAAQVFDSVRALVGGMLRLAPRTAECRVAEAVVFTGRLSATLAALSRGEIALASARAIADETVGLAPEWLPEAQARILARAGGQTTAQIRAHARRVVAELDPEAVRRRAEAAHRDRCVRVEPAPDGMAYLHAYLRADDANLIYQILDHYARAAKTPGDDRSADARRADALVDVVCEYPAADATQPDPGDTVTTGPTDRADDRADEDADEGTASPAGGAHPDASHAEPSGSVAAEVADFEDGRVAGDGRLAEPGDVGGKTGGSDPAGAAERPTTEAVNRPEPGAHPPSNSDPPPPTGRSRGGNAGRSRARARVQVKVVVPLTTLLGLSDTPAHLPGYGPLPAHIARELAADATWQRLITDPASGALLDHGVTRYRPPQALADFVTIRGQTCDHPGCRVPAHRCDIEHTIPHNPAANRGPTNADNNRPRCRTHHRLKHSPGWKVTHEPDGSTTWTTPTGHRLTRHPPQLGLVDQPVPPPATEPELPPF